MNEVGTLSKTLCYLKILYQGVWINRFQLFLTTLTMSFGSLGLALTIFLGDGALHVLWADLEDLLGKWAVVYPTPQENMEMMRRGIGMDFTQKNLDYLKDTVTGTRLICPAMLNEMTTVEYEGSRLQMFWDAIPEELASEEIYLPIQGRGLSKDAFAGNAWECLVTEDVVKQFQLNIKEQPNILLGNRLFRVVGVTVSPPQNDHFRKRITVPYALARVLWMRPGDIGQIVVAWKNLENMEEVIAQTRKALNDIRGEDSYYLSSTQFQIKSSRKIVKNFIVVGTAQSLFCILIASIGVLNVMLTNVTRRTREFAIRVAMGARLREILMIVLAESIFIGMCGAFVGLVMALISAPYLADIMAAGIEEATQLTPDISFKGIFLPLLICGICSLLAGVVPALKVRKMDILAALRENI